MKSLAYCGKNYKKSTNFKYVRIRNDTETMKFVVLIESLKKKKNYPLLVFIARVRSVVNKTQHLIGLILQVNIPIIIYRCGQRRFLCWHPLHFRVSMFTSLRLST